MHSLLYLGIQEQGDVARLFARERGFVLHWQDMDGPLDIPMRPDIVVVEPGVEPSMLLDRAGAIKANLTFGAQGLPPLLFLVAPHSMDKGVEKQILEQGYEAILEPPLDPHGIRHRSRYFMRYKALSQKDGQNRRQLARSFEYLDRFKEALEKNKGELIAEKESLNNALKQVNHLTHLRNRMEDEIHQAQARASENSEAFIQILYSLIRNNVEVDRGHGERVAEIATFLGDKMGVQGKKLEDIQKAAMLHEVGLLSVLRYVGDGDESAGYSKEIQQQYPVKGADLLSRCRTFENAAQILKYLNENSDGTGYPEGLKCRSIPLASRILAGADVFDTLRDDPRMDSLEALVGALGELAGTRLDPAVVGQLEKYAVLHFSQGGKNIRGVGVDDLEPGMELGTAVFTRTGTKLFSGGTVLTRETIEKLIQYNREYPVDETVYIRA
ncbi:MAG: HD domain-containing protein [Desulfobacterales bacterium]|nr:HD domain-containing protein [Desulfobacterales bacterium]